MDLKILTYLHPWPTIIVSSVKMYNDEYDVNDEM